MPTLYQIQICIKLTFIIFLLYFYSGLVAEKQDEDLFVVDNKSSSEKKGNMITFL